MPTTWYIGELDDDLGLMSYIDEKARERKVNYIVVTGSLPIRGTESCSIAHYFHKRERQQRFTRGPSWYLVGGREDPIDHWRSLERGNTVRLAPGCFHVGPASGTYLGRSHAFMGGILSLDYNEEDHPTGQDLVRFRKVLAEEQNLTVVTHDAPRHVADMVIHTSKSPGTISSRLLSGCLQDTHRPPKLWFYSHFRSMQYHQVGPTQFFCCGSLGGVWEVDDKGINELRVGVNL